MKALNTIKTFKIEIDQFTQEGAQVEEERKELAPLSLQRSYSAISSPEDEEVNENCFSCIQEYLKGLLCFISVTAERLADGYIQQGFLDLLYKENLKMYTSTLQDPARKAICSLLKLDEPRALTFLTDISTDVFNKRLIIPAHQLASNINQETYLVLDLLKQ